MNKRVVLASGCDRPYYPRMRQYLESVQANNHYAETFLIGVGWQPPNEHGFIGLELPLSKAQGHGGSSWCVQHGGFLHVLPVTDDDVVVFTDGGDVVMQRDFSASEIEVLDSLQHGTVWVGFDNGENLREYANRVWRPGVPHVLPPEFDLDFPMYNTGVVACTASTYRQLYDSYMAQWPLADSLFLHFARQEWLLTWALCTDPQLKILQMPNTFHTHGFAPLPKTHRFDGDMLCVDGEIVLFKHRVGRRQKQTVQPTYLDWLRNLGLWR